MIDEEIENEDEQSEESFADLFAASQKQEGKLKPGDKMQVKVLQLSAEWVFLDVGQKGEGVLDRREVTDEEGNSVVAPGDMISAWFVGTSKGELRFTTKIGGTGAADRSVVEDAWRAGIPVEGLVEKEVKGGFDVRIGGSRAFCPYSLMSLRRLANAGEMVGKRLQFKIVDYTEGGRNLIVSRRAILEEEAEREKDLLKETLQVGMIVSGVVTSIQKFGAFVRAGGVEGLLPVSEIGYTKIKDVSDVLSVGQELTVVIKQIDWEANRFSFSLKETLADPWDSMADKFPVGSCITGTVSRLAQFGAFVALGDGVDGLLHISKLGKGKRISHPREVLKDGESVEVLVEGVDRENRRIALSLAEVVRAAAEAESDMNSFREQAAQTPEGMGTLGDLLRAKLQK